MGVEDGRASDGDPVRRLSSRIPIRAGTSRERLWAAMTDLALMPGMHPQVLGAHWLDGAREAALGARFATENADPRHGFWLAVSRIVEFRPPTTIAWTIESDLPPAAVCRFDVVEEGGAISLQQTYVVDTRPGAPAPVAEALAAALDAPACGRGPTGPAFVFAVQMLNFPVLPGVSGHLLGGALTAILVGPYVGALCVAIVLVLQALLFADGGLSALGTNITNMALIGTFVGFAVAVALRPLARRSKAGLFATAFVAAWVNTVVASMGFVLEYALGGQGLALGTVFGLMAGFHALIGIGEGLITALTVGAVAAVRPDLVYLLRGRRSGLEIKETVVR